MRTVTCLRSHTDGVEMRMPWGKGGSHLIHQVATSLPRRVLVKRRRLAWAGDLLVGDITLRAALAEKILQMHSLFGRRPAHHLGGLLFQLAGGPHSEGGGVGNPWHSCRAGCAEVLHCRAAEILQHPQE